VATDSVPAGLRFPRTNTSRKCACRTTGPSPRRTSAARAAGRAYYYTALVENDDYCPLRPLVDGCIHGFKVVTKPARNTPTGPRRAASGRMYVEIACDMLNPVQPPLTLCTALTVWFRVL